MGNNEHVVWDLKSHRLWAGFLLFVFLGGVLVVWRNIHFTDFTAVLIGLIFMASIVQLYRLFVFCSPIALFWDGGVTWWLMYKHQARRVTLLRVGWLSRWVVTLQCELPDGSRPWLMFLRGVHSSASLRRLQFQLYCQSF